MEYANYNAVPEKVRREMKYTGTLTGRDGVDITIRFDAERCDIDGYAVKLHNCILRMMVVIHWPDASETTMARCVHHPEFATVRYHCTMRPITQETEEKAERRQIAEAQAGPDN